MLHCPSDVEKKGYNNNAYYIFWLDVSMYFLFSFQSSSIIKACQVLGFFSVHTATS